jgi:hypothetical protein
MKAFTTWKTILTNDLQALRQLEGADAANRMRYVMKEQEIGQHCCQAGESLTDEELTRLKQVLGLNEWQWHSYKSKLLPELE